MAIANFIAFAPDGLTSVGGYPGDDEEGLALFGKVDGAKDQVILFGRCKMAEVVPYCTGKLELIGFCFGGTVTNIVAVRMGSDLDAAST